MAVRFETVSPQPCPICGKQPLFKTALNGTLKYRECECGFPFRVDNNSDISYWDINVKKYNKSSESVKEIVKLLGLDINTADRIESAYLVKNNLISNCPISLEEYAFKLQKGMV